MPITGHFARRALPILALLVAFAACGSQSEDASESASGEAAADASAVDSASANAAFTVDTQATPGDTAEHVH